MKYKIYFILRKLLNHKKININKKNKIQKIDSYSLKKLKKINIEEKLKFKIDKSNYISKKLKQFKYKKYFEFNNNNLPWYYVLFYSKFKNKKKFNFSEKEKLFF